MIMLASVNPRRENKQPSNDDSSNTNVEIAKPFRSFAKCGYEKMMKSPKVTRPSFSYENKMLADWAAAGLKTPEAVAEYEKSDKKKPAGKSEAGFDLDEFFNLAASRGAGGDKA